MKGRLASPLQPLYAKSAADPLESLTSSEESPLFLQSRRIVRKKSCRLNLDRRVCKIVSHLLVIPNEFSELLSLVSVGDGVVKSALCEPDHLRGDPNTAFVEDLDGNLGWNYSEDEWVIKGPPCIPCRLPRLHCLCVTEHHQMRVDKLRKLGSQA